MLVKYKKYVDNSNVFPKFIEKKEWNRRTKNECILKRDIFLFFFFSKHYIKII